MNTPYIQEAITFSEIDRLGEKRSITGNVTLSPGDWTTISNLAKEGIKSRSIINDLKEKISSLIRRITGLEKRLEVYKSKGISSEMKIQQALKRAPRRFAEVITDILRKPPERDLHIPEKVKVKDTSIGR